ncbi:MAG: Unknown protein [uncultured Sulfurovum sp.]|uniref:DUF4124 domain-containing protein n=1 Tax=uncultured Sulfurovum sp. TaxID=269237 RepID=A0A6S6S8Z9_9BACT|nr:MAG: Unknown protein [uncultured Sulfurovum sp.]
MKFLGVVLLLVSLLVNVQAGKVTWDDGRPSISGTAGEGCIESGFGTEEKNATKSDCT